MYAGPRALRARVFYEVNSIVLPVNFVTRYKMCSILHGWALCDVTSLRYNFVTKFFIF